MLLHHREELDNDLGGGADQDLTATGLLGIHNVLETVGKDRDAHHYSLLVGYVSTGVNVN